jgi:FeS assembly SUF system protein
MMQRLAEMLGFRRPAAAAPEPIDDKSETAEPTNGASVAAPVSPAEIAAAQTPERPVAPAPELPSWDDGGDDVADELELRDPFRESVNDALRTVYDPEIPTNIYELGLIYALKIDLEKNVQVEMTLTAPGCPVAGEMPGWVHDAVAGVEAVGRVKVELVWDPPWDPSRMSEIARLETGFDYY